MQMKMISDCFFRLDEGNESQQHFRGKNVAAATTVNRARQQWWAISAEMGSMVMLRCVRMNAMTSLQGNFDYSYQK